MQSAYQRELGLQLHQVVKAINQFANFFCAADKLKHRRLFCFFSIHVSNDSAFECPYGIEDGQP